MVEANDRLRPQERRDLDEYRRLGDKILVLPGFEFTATFGFHVLALFPPIPRSVSSNCCCCA